MRMIQMEKSFRQNNINDDKTQNKQNVFKYSNETPRSPTNLC